jgi:hypothetical protein
MRRTLNLAIGAGAATAAVIMTVGVASAASGTTHQAARPTAAVSAVNKLITKAQAVRIAEAKVPHSRAVEVESDDLHDRAGGSGRCRRRQAHRARDDPASWRLQWLGRRHLRDARCRCPHGIHKQRRMERG